MRREPLVPELPRSERNTKRRVSGPFTDPTRPDDLGCRYLGEWHQRENNRPIEAAALRESLAARGYSSAYTAALLRKVRSPRSRLK